MNTKEFKENSVGEICP